MSNSRLPGLLLTVAAALLLLAPPAQAAPNPATNAFTGFPRAGGKTNLNPRLPGSPIVGGKTNAPVAGAGARGLTNAPSKATATNTVSGLAQKFGDWKSSPVFYPAVGIGLCVVLLLVSRL